MPFLLYRYVLADLARNIILTTAVLVTVIAFGAAIKPLTHEKLLSAAQTLKYICLAIVPMMQFALPFAAGFAATISFHRLTSDNEIVAAAGSGISYRRILTPVIWTGAVLFTIMLILTQSLVPKFYGLMERTVARDLTRIFQASIERGVPFRLGDLQIYADHLVVDTAPVDSEADTRLILQRVAAAETDGDGRIVRDVTAEQAVVDVYREAGRTILKLVMTNTVSYRPDAGELIGAPQFMPSAIVVPSIVSDNTGAMTRGELLKLRADLDRHASVRVARQELAARLHDQSIWSSVDAALRRDGRVDLSGDRGQRYVVQARGFRGQRFLPDDTGEVRIRRYVDNTARTAFHCTSARLIRAYGAVPGDAAVSLVLEDFQVIDLDAPDQPANRRESLSVPSLSYAGLKETAQAPTSSAEMLRVARSVENPSSGLRHAIDRLVGRRARISHEITGRLHERYALSLTAVLLVLVGATFAMWLRESLPLTIYLLAFLPAILDLILISGGEQIVRDGEYLLGGSIMWSGNALLVAILAFSYLRLRRN
jgi:lipopolysaccharide export LptBFGC system permease protein LptF